ncbi:MAG: hybrid sensor histidine kinase/response regulator [Thermodesulfobacteriota bacterium]
MSPPDEPADLSMLEFFRSELAAGAAAIRAGLPALPDGPAPSPEAVPAMVRAAGAIKAAARIVGLSGVEVLARAVEEVLAAARGAGRLPGRDTGETLQAAAEVFMRLSGREPADIPRAVQAEAEGMADLVEALSGAETAAPSGKAPAPAATPAPAPAAPPARAESHADPTMLDLFRMEIETNAAVLDAGLVALEGDQRPERVEPLMRAAHSVKGAARIVGLGLAVELAHAMEDLLEACRQGRMGLSAGHIDLLLAGNDVFSRLSGLPAGDIPAGLAALADRIAQVRGALDGCLNDPAAPPRTSVPVVGVGGAGGEPVPAGPGPAVSASAVPPARSPGAGDTTGDRVVRVTAANLNRLMGLAGECLVEARSLASMNGIFTRLKAGQDALSLALAAFREALMTGEVSGGGPAFPGAGPGADCGGRLAQAGQVLAASRDVLSQGLERFDLFSRRLENLADRLYNEVIDSRMRRFSDGLRGFPRMVRDLARDLGKRVSFTVEGQDTKVDREILERLEAPLNHLLRNALDHGLEVPEERARAGKPETGVLTVSARHFAGILAITVTDDGRGLDPERIRAKVLERGLASSEMAADLSDAELMDFLFLPGFTTAGKVTEISGRGVGLDVVHSMVREVGGQVRAESRPGQGMGFFLRLPLTLSVVRTLLVDVAGEAYAVPLTRIDRIVSLDPGEIKDLEGRQYCVFDGESIGLAPAWRVLGAREPGASEGSPGIRSGISVVVVSDRLGRFGMVVQGFLGERDLVVKPLDPRLGKVPCVSAASVMEDGSPVLILDVDDMVRAVDNLLSRGRLDRVGEAVRRPDERVRRILVVDDSLTVRETQRRLLANRGYGVDTAVDGMDGLNALRGGDFDLVITDVDMPRMDGIELVRRIRADTRLAALPVMIVSYKDREEDRLLGLDAGADYYLGKGSFQDERLLDAVADLIGGPEA